MEKIMNTNNIQNNPLRIIISIIGVILLIIVLSFAGSLWENVPAGEIAVIQTPFSGKLNVYTTPGVKWQGTGKVVKYKKRFQFWFSSSRDQGKKEDESITIRFNDGGHAKISGCISCDTPADEISIKQLHIKYGSQEAIEKELVRPVLEKAIYMSGPLMSSAESYSAKRAQLINFIEDQAARGVYKTSCEEVKTKDLMTGTDKTITVVKLLLTDNKELARVEESPLQTFKIRPYNLSINRISYSPEVETQISQQQKAIMEVQTAIAEAKKAEQRAYTEEQEGKARAAKAKWDQEEIKATEVTAAQQRLEVAELEKQAAEQTKQKEILLGQGESERKKLVMEADGALDKKLDAYIKVMQTFASEFGKQKLVPETQIISGSANNGQINASNFIDLLTAKTLKDLNVDMSMKGK